MPRAQSRQYLGEVCELMYVGFVGATLCVPCVYQELFGRNDHHSILSVYKVVGVELFTDHHPVCTVHLYGLSGSRNEGYTCIYV